MENEREGQDFDVYKRVREAHETLEGGAYIRNIRIVGPSGDTAEITVNPSTGKISTQVNGATIFWAGEQPIYASPVNNLRTISPDRILPPKSIQIKMKPNRG